MRIKLKDKSRPLYSVPLIALAGATLIVGGGFLTATAYTVMQQSIAKQADSKIQEVTDGYVDSFIQHLEAYSDALYATRGLFAAAQVDADVWDRFVHAQSAPNRYAGMKSIAYAEIVPHQNVREYERVLQTTQSADVTIRPLKDNGDYTVLTYHEDLSQPDTKLISALGFDLNSSPERLQALTQASKNGVMTASARLNLVSNAEPGFLLILPLTERFGITSQGKPFGYVIAAFEFNGLFDRTIASQLETYATSVRIDDITESQSVPLYTKSQTFSGTKLTREVTIKVANRTWRVTFELPQKQLLLSTQRYAPVAILAIGIGFTLIICSLSYALRLRHRLKYSDS